MTRRNNKKPQTNSIAVQHMKNEAERIAKQLENEHSLIKAIAKCAKVLWLCHATYRKSKALRNAA